MVKCSLNGSPTEYDPSGEVRSTLMRRAMARVQMNARMSSASEHVRERVGEVDPGDAGEEAERRDAGEQWNPRAHDPSPAISCRSAGTDLAGQDLVDHLRGGDAAQLGVGAQHDAVAEHAMGELLDVVGGHVVATLGRGARLRGVQQPEAAARRGAQRDVGVLARALHDAHAVLLEGVVAEDGLQLLAAGLDLRGVGDGGEVVERRLALEAVEHGHLVGQLEVAEVHLDEEAVDLRLGQREGAAELDRVLGGQHDEGRGQGVGDPVDGDLALLHGLEQRRLRLGGGPVDLVGEEDLGEDRALAELELGGLEVEDRDPGDVPGEQVGCELEPLEVAAGGPGHCLGEHRLAHPGHVLDEHVAAAEEGEHAELDLLLLAHDHRADARRRGGVPPLGRDP